MHSEPVPELEKDDIYRIVHVRVRLSLGAGGKGRIVGACSDIVSIGCGTPAPAAAAQAHVVLQKEGVVS